MGRARSALVVAFVVLASVAGTSLAFAGHRSAARVRAPRVLGARYVDLSGWSIDDPRGMQLERSEAGVRAKMSEVTFASFLASPGVELRLYTGGGSLKALPPVPASGGVFPTDGVAFRMFRFVGDIAPFGDAPDSRFPVTLNSFRPSRVPSGLQYYAGTGETGARSTYHHVPQSRARAIEANGTSYLAIVWTGSHVSPQLRARLARMIASLSFPRLRPGEQINGLHVLQPAVRYPVRSFTIVSVPEEICPGGPVTCQIAPVPFYLVHAPGRMRVPNLIFPCSPPGSCVPAGGFYALGWTEDGTQGGYRSRCQLTLDRAHDEFYCTNMRARWDRVGRVIARPRGARINDPLQFIFAKIAWDGHVILTTRFSTNPPGAAAIHLLWPGWR